MHVSKEMKKIGAKPENEEEEIVGIIHFPTLLSPTFSLHGAQDYLKI